MTKSLKWPIVVTACIQLLTAIFHSLSIFIEPIPASDEERTLIELMRTYHMDAGAGFTPTFDTIVKALSSCFSLICLLGGLQNLLILKFDLPKAFIKSFYAINSLIFLTVFLVMGIWTFLPPIVLTGLILMGHLWIIVKIRSLEY